jgi:hypothetical protein
MGIRDILDTFTAAEAEEEKSRQERARRKIMETEARLDDIHDCFEKALMPVIREAVDDFRETGFYYKLEIGQPAFVESGKRRIKDITLYFFPVVVRDLGVGEASLIRDYRLLFTPAKGYKGVKVSTKVTDRQSVMEVELDRMDRAGAESMVRDFVKAVISDYKAK